MASSIYKSKKYRLRKANLGTGGEGSTAWYRGWNFIKGQIWDMELGQQLWKQESMDSVHRGGGGHSKPNPYSDLKKTLNFRYSI